MVDRPKYGRSVLGCIDAKLKFDIFRHQQIFKMISLSPQKSADFRLFRFRGGACQCIYFVHNIVETIQTNVHLFPSKVPLST